MVDEKLAVVSSGRGQFVSSYQLKVNNLSSVLLVFIKDNARYLTTEVCVEILFLDSPRETKIKA